MSMDTVAAIAVFVFIFVMSGVMARANTVVIKNENSLITYKVNYNNSTEEAYSIDTYTYAGTDVSTLKLLGVPEDAWPMFANSQYTIFSSEAYGLQKENKRLQEDLNDEQQNRSDAENSLATYRLLFWFTIILSVIVSSVLAVNLANAKKELRRNK